MKSAKYDLWLVNGNREFGIMPAGVLEDVTHAAPICLQRGDPSFGATHIAQKHGRWLQLNKRSAPQMVWDKCRQPGSIYTTEEREKRKVRLPIVPSALMILEYVSSQQFWTVISLYFNDERLDGECIGPYKDTLHPLQVAPLDFGIEGPVTPLIRIKKKKKLIMPPDTDDP